MVRYGYGPLVWIKKRSWKYNGYQVANVNTYLVQMAEKVQMLPTGNVLWVVSMNIVYFWPRADQFYAGSCGLVACYDQGTQFIGKNF